MKVNYLNAQNSNFLIVLIVLYCFTTISSHSSSKQIEINKKLKNLSEQSKPKKSTISHELDLHTILSTSSITSLSLKNQQNITQSVSDTDISISLLPFMDYTKATVTSCDINKCEIENGICTSAQQCTCNNGKANFPILTNNRLCAYKQRKQIIAFLLELGLTCGIGHFYIGAWWNGMIKLLVIVLIPIFFCSLMICSDIFIKGYKLMIILFSLTGGLYWIGDSILFAINYYRDGNGVPLEHW